MSECVSCGAPMRVDVDRGLLVCAHCGSEKETPGLIERIELLEATSNACPGCGGTLSAARLDGHELLCCARCFGTLVAMNRFAAVIEALRVHVRPGLAIAHRPTRRGAPIACPTCGSPMTDHLYGGPGNVAIDTCERCLVNWLDPGELRRIAAAPDTRRV